MMAKTEEDLLHAFGGLAAGFKNSTIAMQCIGNYISVYFLVQIKNKSTSSYAKWWH